MLLLPGESIDEYVLAAHQRLGEGTQLQIGSPNGAVYLFGYVAELTIKAATYRLFGLPVNQCIPNRTFQHVEWMMKKDGLRLHGPHDIMAWANFLVDHCKPMLSGAAYPLGFGNDVKHHAGMIDANWSPSLRYYGSVVAPPIAAIVQQSSNWFVANAANL